MEENQFSVVADRSCQNTSGEYKGGQSRYITVCMEKKMCRLRLLQ